MLSRRVPLLISSLLTFPLTGWCDFVYTNPNPITLTPSTSEYANSYPSQITVPLTGTLTGLADVTVTLDSWSMSASPDNLYFMLVGPGGQTFEFLGGVDRGADGVDLGNYTFADDAAALVPSEVPGGEIAIGTYKPTVYGAGCTTFPSPAPAVGGLDCAATDNIGTFDSVFGGINPSGTWSLYEFDSSTTDPASSIANGWTLTLNGDLVPTPEPSALFTLPAALFAVVALRISRK
jgi:hypothetical protein